jgi:CHAT domain-containing protein
LENVDKIKKLEREIVSSIGNYKDIFDDSKLKWENIRDCLKAGEAAIEFTMFSELVTEDRAIIPYLGALIIRSDSDFPVFVRLCRQRDINAILRKGNKSDSQLIDELYNLANDELYNSIFKPIEKHLTGCKTVYFSPVDKLHKINIQAISTKGERLMDRYNLIEVSSTAILLERENDMITNELSSAFVVGGIDYNEDIEEMVLEANKYSEYSPNYDLATRSSYRGMWDNIPGTLFEAESIDSLLHNHKIESTFLKGRNANEESIKHLNGHSPDIIHIATHGFFYNKKEESSTHFFDNTKSHTGKGFPMKYSGLLFAGANNVWTGKALPNHIEDGVLTAEEISQMDLANTKLVVLSACDTGLGEIGSVDGVYGLQRGFKMAGVETIMMSLWKIPDEATSILMVEFYRNLLSGKSKHQSLKDAQKHLRQVENGKYDKPEYWASFIMLDGLN